MRLTSELAGQVLSPGFGEPVETPLVARVHLSAASAQKLVVAAVVPMVAITAWLALGSDHLRWPVASALYWSYLVAASVGVGLYWWRRRPASRFGPLLVAFAIVLWIVSFENSNASLPYTIGVIAEGPFFLMSIYLFLAFPMGRVEPPSARWLMAALWVVLLGLFVPAILLRPMISPSTPLGRCVTDCPGNALQLGTNVSLGLNLLKLETYCTLTIVAATFAIYLRRVLVATRPQRRTLLAVGVTSLLFLPAFFVSNFSAWILKLQPTTLDTLSWFVVGTRVLLPLGFLVALLQAELRAAKILRILLERLATRPSPHAWRDTIADALDDPALRIGYRDPPTERYIDPDGAPLAMPPDGSGRVWVPVDYDDHAVAAMLLDETLAEDPELVRAGATATVVAVENGALEGELRASRANLMEAGYDERRRMERDIHDSAQQRLVALRMHLALAGEQLGSSPGREVLARLDGEVELAIEELRAVAQRTAPQYLSERGIGPALQAIAVHSPIPVRVIDDGLRRHPAALEATVYFCCLESLQNATKHAGRGSSVTVHLDEDEAELRFSVEDDGAGFDPAAVERGSGLTNLAERMRAVGGTLKIDARPAHGTRITGRLPVT